MSSTDLTIASSEQDYDALLSRVRESLDTAVRLPHIPFLSHGNHVSVCEYDLMLSGAFQTVVEQLSRRFEDAAVVVVGLSPEPAYYKDNYGFLPAFSASAEKFAAGLQYEPNGDIAGAMAYTLDVIAVTGSSGAWSAWGQRDWEIGLLSAREADGPWLRQEVKWFEPPVDLKSIRSPSGWGMPLTEDDESALWRNVQQRESE